jgi:hypothetical protein
MINLNELIEVHLVSGNILIGHFQYEDAIWFYITSENKNIYINKNNIEYFIKLNSVNIVVENNINENKKNKELLKPIDLNTADLKEVDITLRAMKLADLKKIQIEKEKSNIKDYMSDNNIDKDNNYYKFPSFKKKL